jgi:hypothetical protein
MLPTTTWRFKEMTQAPDCTWEKSQAAGSSCFWCHEYYLDLSCSIPELKAQPLLHMHQPFRKGSWLYFTPCLILSVCHCSLLTSPLPAALFPPQPQAKQFLPYPDLLRAHFLPKHAVKELYQSKFPSEEGRRVSLP